MQLSQCMIVKNEEKNIERALSWAKDIVCEQIVVDTGSTDRTVEIAERMGAKVFHLAWQDDFSAAKNYAIEQAKGNWIAFLDADEHLSQEDAGNLVRALKAIDQLKTKDAPQIIRSPMISFDDDGRQIQVIKQDRVFRNMKDLRFKNPIHECLAFPPGSNRELIFYDMGDKMSILHTGYSSSAIKETKKEKRNLRILRQAVEKDPENMELLIYLAGSLIANNLEEEAQHVFAKIMDRGLDQVPAIFGNRALYQLMLCKVCSDDANKCEEVEALYQKAISYDPTYPEYDFLMGMMYGEQEKWQEIIFYYEKSLEKLHAYRGESTINMYLEMKRVYQALTVSSYQINDLNRVIRYSVLCLRLEKFTADVLQILMYVFMKELPQDSRVSETMKILQGLYDITVLKDRIFLWKCGNGVGFTELCCQIEQFMSQDERKILTDESRQS